MRLLSLAFDHLLFFLLPFSFVILVVVFIIYYSFQEYHAERSLISNILKLTCILSRHKTRLHIGQLVKDTSAKLKQASETDHRAEVSVSIPFESPVNLL